MKSQIVLHTFDVQPSTGRAPASYFRHIGLISLIVFLIFCSLIAVPVSHHLRAAAVLVRISDPNAQTWLARYGTNPTEVRQASFPFGAQTIRAREYVPVGIAHPPAMVVVPGVHHLGYDEPRLRNFSLALASNGILVLTPQIDDFSDYNITPAASRIIGESVLFLCRSTGNRQVGLLGLSFAGGSALIAAAEPEVAPSVNFVVAIGAHDDIGRVLRYYVTDKDALPDGGTETLPAHEYGLLVAAFMHPEEFFAGGDVDQARVALRERLWEHIPESEAAAKRLSPAGQKMLADFFAHKTDQLAPSILAGIEKRRPEIAETSPHGNLAALKAQVFLLHGAADNVVPPAETLWLERDVPAGLLRESLISPVVSHVELGRKPKVSDYVRLVHWMAMMLDAADDLPRSH